MQGMADSSSVSSTERKKRCDHESSSEQSAAETVIYLGNGKVYPFTVSDSIHFSNAGRRSSKDKILRESRIPTAEAPLKPLQLHVRTSIICIVAC